MRLILSILFISSLLRVFAHDNFIYYLLAHEDEYKIKWDNILEIRKIMKKHSENILSTKHGFYPIIQQLLEKGKLTLKFQMKL